MRYFCPMVLFLPRNEILSLLALLILAVMFIFDIVRAREEMKSWK